MNGMGRGMAPGGGAHAGSALNSSIMQVLEHVEYRLVTGGEDLEEIYRLRYQSYLRAGIATPNGSGLFEDRWDNLPNSYRFGVYCYERLVSTLRLHYVSKDHPYSPSLDGYPEVLKHRVERGETFIEGTRFATDPDSAPAPGMLPFLTLRLGMVASCYFGQTSVLIPVKIEHAAYYARIFNARQIAEGKAFPGVLVQGALFEIPCGENLRLTLERFPFFKSTPTEQRLMFSNPAINPLTPQTIVPTAKYLREAA